MKKEDTDFVMICLEKSDKHIKEILKDAGDLLFVANRVSEITGDPVDLTRTEALFNEVTKRVGILEYAFVNTLSAYIEVSKLAKHSDVLEIISELKDISYDVIRNELPPVLHLLEEISHLQNRPDRLARLESLLRPTVHSIKFSTITRNNTKKSMQYDSLLERLYYAVNQILEEIECQEIIPDMRLLAVLVLVREDIRFIGQKNDILNINSEAGYLNRQLPVAELAFLKELMLLSDATKRKAFLKDAFSKDERIMYGTGSDSDTKLYRTQSRDTKTPSRTKMNSSDHKKVRPGRFIDSISVLKKEFSVTGYTQSQEERIHELSSNCCEVLEEIAAGYYNQ